MKLALKLGSFDIKATILCLFKVILQLLESFSNFCPFEMLPW